MNIADKTARRLLACVGLLLAPWVAMAGESRFIPDSWGGKASVGYERRTTSGDVSGDPDAGTGVPRYWYTEPDDAIGLVNFWGRWKFRPFSRPTRIKLEYERLQWKEGGILSRDVLELELRQDLSSRSRLELEIEFTPQVYNTHRIDKDALPGQPRFRPEAYQETEAELAYRYAWSPDFFTTATLSYTARDETPWFRERDRRRPGAGVGLDFKLGPHVRLVPEYTFRSNSSRNEPDLGKDLSYREHVVDLQVGGGFDGPMGPWRLDLETRWKFRHYTTTDAEDTRRFGRDERIYTWRIVLRRPAGIITPFAAWEIAGRAIDVPGDVEDVDEADDIDRRYVQLGMEWRY